MDFEDMEKQRQEGLKAGETKNTSPSQNTMTLRERFLRTMHFQRVDLIPNYEFGYWDETLTTWRRDQGLPASVVDEASAYDYFGIERYAVAPVDTGMKPYVEAKTLEQNDERIVLRDGYGCVYEMNAQGNKSIPHYLEFPVKDRKTWEVAKQGLIDMANRYPANWDELVETYRTRDYPLGIWFGSLVGVARNIIGFENIALMICEEPELMEEIVETFCECSCKTIERAVRDMQFDFAGGWEDICFNSGPIVGLPFFRNVVTPRYKRITDILRQHGITTIFTDCDGNLNHIAQCFIDGGINTMFPIEVHGGTDPVALRKKFGKEIKLWGGVDKMIFLEDKAAVKKEMERLLPAVEEGGFIPTVDHRVQADASLDLYKYYMDLKREMFHVGGEGKY